MNIPKMLSSLLAMSGLAIICVGPGHARAATPTLTTLVSFNSTNGAVPLSSLIADASGNLFGTTYAGGAYGYNGGYGWGTVFEVVKAAGGYASTPTTLVTFNHTNGAFPQAGLLADAAGNLFGTTCCGGANNGGTVFEIAKTADGYAATPTILYSFCAQTNCTDGGGPRASLIADASGNLFGTTGVGGTNNDGTVFEMTGSGFVPRPLFAGTPGKANCHGQSVSTFAKKYGGLDAAAAGLGYSSVQVLQNNIDVYCAG